MPRLTLLLAATLLSAPLRLSAQTASPLLACFVPKSGTMYVVGQPGAPEKCRSVDHVLLQWNAVGPAGPQGAVGPAGPAGAPGAGGATTLTGSTALSGHEIVKSRQVISALIGGSVSYLIATCPVGKVAIAGGALSVAQFTGGYLANGAAVSWVPYLVGSYPNSAFGYSDREWVVQFFTPLSVPTVVVGGPVPFDVVVTCAKVN